MPDIYLSDKEVAVIIDCLRVFREEHDGSETPNVDSALEKINRLMTPSTNGLTVLPGRFRYDGLRLVCAGNGALELVRTFEGEDWSMTVSKEELETLAETAKVIQPGKTITL